MQNDILSIMIDSITDLTYRKLYVIYYLS